MLKKAGLIGLVLATVMVFSGCGKVAQNTGDQVEANPSVELTGKTKGIVIASSKINMEFEQEAGLQTSAIQDVHLTSQVMSIETDVPEYMTFSVTSNVRFNVQSLSKVEAGGVITVNVVYNNLLGADLSRVKVIAYLQGAGFVGQTDASRRIPLDVKVLGFQNYQPLTTANVQLRTWGKPFSNIINETLRLKLRGDFSNAFMQKYKGTIKLDFVREDDNVPPANQLLLWNRLGSPTEVMNSVYGPNGDVIGSVDFLASVSGNGFSPAPRIDHNQINNYVVFNNLTLRDKGSVEFWYTPTWKYSNIGHVVDLLYFSVPTLIGNPGGFDVQYNDWQDRLQFVCYTADRSSLITKKLVPSEQSDWIIGRPMHMAFTWDASAVNDEDKIRIFINGTSRGVLTDAIGDTALAVRASNTVGNILAGSRDINGDWSRHNWEGLDGIMDELKVWNFARTTFDINVVLPPPPPIPVDGLVAFYPLNGDASDASGYGNNGVIKNALPVFDRKGYSYSAYSFNGADSGIRANVGTTLSNPNFSISVWANVTGPGEQNPRLVGVGPSENMQFHSYSLLLMGGQNLSCYFNTLGYAGASSLIPYNAGWHNYVLTFDGSNVVYYIDGVKNTEEATSATIPYFINGVMTIGYSNNLNYSVNGADHFQGSLDEVRVYNRALSANEVSALAQN